MVNTRLQEGKKKFYAIRLLWPQGPTMLLKPLRTVEVAEVEKIGQFGQDLAFKGRGKKFNIELFFAFAMQTFNQVSSFSLIQE